MQDGNNPLPDIASKNAELVTKVNAVMNGSFVGVEELKDVCKTFFDLCSIIEVKLEGGSPTALNIIGQVLPGILPAILGVDKIPAEVSDLQDEEITELVGVGEAYPLGDNAVKYQQVLKILLVAFQTVFIFKN